MDPNVQNAQATNTLPTMSVSSSSRKRSRENESPSQRHKREKAAERQRRKRERDRNAGLNVMAMSQAVQQHQQQHQQAPMQAQPAPVTDFLPAEVTPEELARRERVRTAARERQRKHRALVKQRKLRELGLDMGNDIIPGMEDVQYRVQSDGQYHPVLQPDMSQGPMGPHNEPPFPQGQLVGGQTFASTLLLSFSCAPLLKQHLLRTLSMTNEELASLEPIIAQAWEQWDHQRRMHYAQQAQVAAANSVKPPEPHQLAEASSSAYTNVDMTDHTGGYPDPNQASPNDFRARFHRPLVAPSPFRNFATDARTTATTSTPTSTASVQGQDTIDPHLAAAMAEAGDPRRTIDPELGQARGEAEGVVGRLERG